MAAVYECDECGACCRTFPIFASAEDAAREPRIGLESLALPDHLATDDWKFQLYPLPFLESCCFLETDRRCEIYPSRPGACRAFAAGSEQCQEARKRNGLAALEPADHPGSAPKKGIG